MILSSMASKLIFSNTKKQKRPSVVSPRTIPRPSICIPELDEVDEVEEIETPMTKLIKKVRLLQSLNQEDTVLINEMSREDILSILMEYSSAIKFFIGVKQIR